YLFGQRGVVERVVGSFPNPERRSYNEEGPKQPLYRARFRQHALFPSALIKLNAADTIDLGAAPITTKTKHELFASALLKLNAADTIDVEHELFPSALLKFNAADTIDVEVYQCWLQVRFRSV
ncbi:hypothetical protein T484DRAFT_1811487, partial [Baffinella frigidus]